MIEILLIRQLVVLLLMMACGFLLVKTGLLKVEDSKALSVITIYAITPCVIINSFQIEYSDSVRDGFLLAVGAAVIIHIALLLMSLVFEKLFHITVVEKASLMYSNAGNLVIPLVTAVLGEEWVIYASAFLSVQMIMMWTHGNTIMSGAVKLDLKKILTNINMIAIIAGVVLFLGRIRLPLTIGTAMKNMSAMIAPVSMLMLGMMMSSIQWKKVFSKPRIYLITFLKMIVSPLVLLVVLRLLRLDTLVDNGRMILLVSFFAVITPSATTIVQLALLNDRDPDYASAINIFTTLVCAVTMPLLVMIYQL